MTRLSEICMTLPHWIEVGHKNHSMLYLEVTHSLNLTDSPKTRYKTSEKYLQTISKMESKSNSFCY